MTLALRLIDQFTELADVDAPFSNGAFLAWDTGQSKVVEGYTPESIANKATGFGVVNHTLYPTVQSVKTYVDALVVGLLDDRGNYDASGNVFPSTGGSGTAGAVLKGDLWYISVAGTLGGTAVSVGSSVRALVDSPGQTAGNWDILDVGLGYVPENVANKATSFAVLNDTLYPTTQAVSDFAQPKDSDLTAIAALTPSNDDVIQRKSGAWTNRTMGQLATDLGVAPGGSSGDIQYNNAGAFGGSLLKQGTNVIQQRNGANPQDFELYDTYTADDNYNKVILKAASNFAALIFVGAGASRIDNVPLYISTSNPGCPIEFQTAGTSRWRINESTGNWLNQAVNYVRDAGRARVSTQFDKTSDTALADVTGLSVILQAGGVFSFEAVLYTTSNIAGGVKAAIGGTATVTSIIYEAEVAQAGELVAPGTVRATALGTAVGDVTAVTTAKITIKGTIVVNAAGTLTVQFAQNTSDGNASSVLAGSSFVVRLNP